MAKLVFKSVEEREKAYDEIPDIDEAPANTNLDEWQAEQEQKIQDVLNRGLPLLLSNSLHRPQTVHKGSRLSE